MAERLRLDRRAGCHSDRCSNRIGVLGREARLGVGGNVAPDTLVFTAEFSRRFDVDRRSVQLAHDLLTTAPWLRLQRRLGP